MKRLCSIAALALALSACAGGAAYRAQPMVEAGLPPAYQGAAAPGPAEDLTRWWERFDDPLLARLIADADAANLDIDIAAARLRQAREGLVQARAGLVPSLGASAGVGRNFGDGRDRTSFQVGGDAAYEVDLFGGIASSIAAAGADAAGAHYDLEAVRVAIAAEVALNYIQARLAQERLAIARDTLAIADDNLQIAEWRVQAGLVSSLDAEQARAARAQTAATIPTLETGFAGASYRLAVLTGRPPGALADTLAPPLAVPEGPDSVAVGIPADTLRQRPDVRGAEASLIAAGARIGVAEAQLLPGLRLTGNIGTSAFSLGGLFDAVTGGLFAGLSQTLFDGGRLRSQVRVQEAAADAALAAYRQSVLTAIEDVENALSGLESARARQESLLVALDAATSGAVLARSSYQAGLIDFQTLLESERSLLSARDGLASSRADQALALVQLYRALGGGWEPAAAPPIGSQQ